jgi:hypothetical protein
MLLGALALVAVHSVAIVAAAQDEPSSEETPEPVEPVAIRIEGADALGSAIRKAILAELATTLEPKSPRRIDVTIDDELVVVRFIDDDGTIVGRELERPDEDDELVELVALMAGNLARDQAGALLAELEVEPEPPEEPVEEPEPETAEAPDAPVDEEASRAAVEVEVEPLPSPDPELPELPDPAPWEPELTFGQAAFVSPLGVFWDSEERAFNLDFSVLFGRSGGLRGLGIHGVGSLVHGDHDGLSISGVWAYRAGALHGVSLAGLVHASSSPRVDGLEIGGVANLDVFGDQRTAVRGMQIAGVVNAAGDVGGAQLGGVVNVAGDLRGVQIGGVSNVARDGGGLQLAGVTNHVGDFAGVQLSGGVNTARDVKGLQLGLVNVARRVEGAQIGLVNVAEENEGTAVGLVNAAGNGDIQVATWAGITSVSNIGLKMRVGPLFIQPGAGFHPIDGKSMSGQVAVGGHIPIDPVFVEIVTGYAYELPLENEDGTSATDQEGHHQARLLAQVGIQLNEYIGFFGGAGVHADFTQSLAEDEADLSPEVVGGILLF